MLLISFCSEVLIVNPVRNHLILAFNKENTVYIIQNTDFGSFFPSSPSPPTSSSLCNTVLLILVNYILDLFFFLTEMK